MGIIKSVLLLFWKYLKTFQFKKLIHLFRVTISILLKKKFFIFN